MQKYGQYCPVSRAVDILGDRWTLLIVRDLVHGVDSFNDLARGLPRLSRGRGCALFRRRASSNPTGGARGGGRSTA